MVLIMCSVQRSVTDAWHCVQLHPNLCTPEWDLPGMESDCNNEWYSVSTPSELSDHLAILGGLPIDTYLVSKKFYKSPLTKLWFWCCNGRFTFKTTKL